MTARIWDEFGGAASVVLSDLGPSAPVVDRVGGLSGELGGDLTLSRSEGAEAFVGGSVRDGRAREAVRAVAGFRVRW